MITEMCLSLSSKLKRYLEIERRGFERCLKSFAPLFDNAADYPLYLSSTLFYPGLSSELVGPMLDEGLPACSGKD
jgi:hypothetical protein